MKILIRKKNWKELSKIASITDIEYYGIPPERIEPVITEVENWEIASIGGGYIKTESGYTLPLALFNKIKCEL